MNRKMHGLAATMVGFSMAFAGGLVVNVALPAG